MADGDLNSHSLNKIYARFTIIIFKDILLSVYILLSEGFSRGCSVNPVCKLQPIDAVVELGWD